MYITTAFSVSLTTLLFKFNTHLVRIPFLGETLYILDTRLAGLLIKVTDSKKSRKCVIPVVCVKLGKWYVVKHNCVT